MPKPGGTEGGDDLVGLIFHPGFGNLCGFLGFRFP